MNLVAVLIAPAVVQLSVGDDASKPLRYAIALVAVVIIVAALVVTKRRTVDYGETPTGPQTPAEPPIAEVTEPPVRKTVDVDENAPSAHTTP